MKNPIICKNCNAENPFYQHICLNCKSYMRERVVNIDLWKVVGLLIENPVKGFSQIIHSEHKNFVSFIIIFAALKLIIDAVFISVAYKNDNALMNFLPDYLIFLAVFSLSLYLFSFILNLVDKKINLPTRVKDHFAVNSYAFMPHIFALVFLLPLELILFGGFLFSYNPSPFQLKSTLAYTFLVFEFLIIAWGVFLTFMAAYTQSGSRRYSLFVTLSFYLLLSLIIFLFIQLFL
ncbi:MAG: hypothetical protein R6W90_12840 [Ignavibacteriaceae bacterium]